MFFASFSSEDSSLKIDFTYSRKEGLSELLTISKRYGSRDLNGIKKEVVNKLASSSSNRQRFFDVNKGSPFSGFPTFASTISLIAASLKFMGNAISSYYETTLKLSMVTL